MLVPCTVENRAMRSFTGGPCCTCGESILRLLFLPSLPKPHRILIYQRIWLEHTKWPTSAHLIPARNTLIQCAHTNLTITTLFYFKTHPSTHTHTNLPYTHRKIIYYPRFMNRPEVKNNMNHPWSQLDVYQIYTLATYRCEHCTFTQKAPPTPSSDSVSEHAMLCESQYFPTSPRTFPDSKFVF